MKIFCRLGSHEAIEATFWNNGNYFTTCRRCGQALVRGEGPWRAVPRGYKVVWKPRTEFDVDWAAWEREHAGEGEAS